MVTLSCPTHGQFETYQALAGSSQIAHLCPRCADDRNNVDVQRKAERRNQQWRMSKLRELQSVARLPRRFEATTFDDYVITNEGQRQAHALCFAYAKTWLEQVEKCGNLVILGPTDVGKTMLACAVGNTVMAEFMGSVTFGTVSDYCRQVRSSYGANRTGGKTEMQILQVLRSADLAILDDVGVATNATHNLEVLFDIVDGRWRDGRPTIVTSNLNLEQLQSHLGDRFMKRLRNHDAWTVVACDFDGFDSRQGALL